MNLIFLSLVLEEFEYLGSILLLHFPNSSLNVNTLFVWKTIPSLKLFHRKTLRQICVFYLNQFLDVNKAVEIVRSTEWGWLRMTRGVEGLWVSKHSLSSHHFRDDNLSHLFLSQRMVDGQKVDFNHFQVAAANLELLWYTHDTGKNFLILAVSYEEKELRMVAGTSDTPPELFQRVVKSEMTDLIFDVVLHQKFNDLLAFGVISYIEIAPFKPCR